MFHNIQTKILHNTKQITSILAFVFSLITPFLIINYSYFPFLGFAITFILLATLILFARPPITANQVVLFSFIVCLSCFLVIRANPFLTFLNFTTLLYSLALLVYPVSKKDKYTLSQLAFLPLAVFGRALNETNKYPLWKPKIQLNKEKKETKPVAWRQIFLGICLTLPILFIVVPILSSTNPIFADYMRNLSNLFNISWLLDKLDYILSEIFGREMIARILFFFFLWFFTPKLLSFAKSPAIPTILPNKNSVLNQNEIKEEPNLVILVPKVILAFILIIFIVSQFQLYFSSKETLAALGYSYGRYANEVFGQLSFVSLVIFGFIYFDNKRDKNSMLTSILLIVQGIFLVLMALKSDLEYILTWGLTFKRLYGFVIVALLAGFYGFFVFHLKEKSYSLEKFSQSCVVYILALLVLVNAVNFDFLIFNVSRPKEAEGTSYHYFVELSTDAQADDQILAKFLELNSGNYAPNTSISPMYRYDDNANNPPPSDKKSSSYLVNYESEIRTIQSRIRYLQQKYSEPVFTSFNLSEYLMYQRVKDIPVSPSSYYID